MNRIAVRVVAVGLGMLASIGSAFAAGPFSLVDVEQIAHAVAVSDPNNTSFIDRHEAEGGIGESVFAHASSSKTIDDGTGVFAQSDAINHVFTDELTISVSVTTSAETSSHSQEFTDERAFSDANVLLTFDVSTASRLTVTPALSFEGENSYGFQSRIIIRDSEGNMVFGVPSVDSAIHGPPREIDFAAGRYTVTVNSDCQVDTRSQVSVTTSVRVTAIPLPPAVWSCLVGLVLLGILQRPWKRSAIASQ